MFGVLLLIVFAVVTWCVASEGAWGAGVNALCVIFAGLLAMNFFEPVAELLSGSPAWALRADFIALVGLFAIFVTLLRFLVDRLAFNYMDVDTLAHDVGRWAFGLLSGYVTMAFLCTAWHTVPLPRTVTSAGVQEPLGFKGEGGNLFGMNPDRQWLAFTQMVSRRPLARGTGEYAFDNPQYQVGSMDQQNWPSFPLRYASRRETLSTGTLPTASGSPGGGLQSLEPAPSEGNGGF